MDLVTRPEYENDLKVVWDRMAENSTLMKESLRQTESLLSEVVKSTGLLSSAVINRLSDNNICQQHAALLKLIEQRRKRFQMQTISTVAAIMLASLILYYTVKL